jgi:hypothetical protein
MEEEDWRVAVEWLRFILRECPFGADLEQLIGIANSLGICYQRLGDRRRAVRFAYRALVLAAASTSYERWSHIAALNKRLKQEIGTDQYSEYCVAGISELSGWDVYRLSRIEVEIDPDTFLPGP